MLSFVDAPAPSAEPTLTVAQDRRLNAVEETAAFCRSDGLTVASGSYEVSARHPLPKEVEAAVRRES